MDHHVVQLLAASIHRQALAHGVTMTPLQARLIANNSVVALTVDASCPACSNALCWERDRLVCIHCARVALRVDAS